MNPNVPSTSDVSVVMTAMTDKERPWVMEALDSVLNQSVKPDAVIIHVELGNTWIEHDLQTSAHPAEVARLVQVHRIPMARLGAVRNIGTEKAKTTWVAFMDGDDVWEPNKLELQLEAARQHPDANFVGADLVFIDERGKRFGFANGTNPTPSSWMVRRELMRQYPFDPDNKQGEDYFWLIATRPVSKRVRVPEVLVRYRIRGNSISAIEDGRSRQRKLRELASRAVSYPVVRYPLLAATYVRYLLRRGTTYDV